MDLTIAELDDIERLANEADAQLKTGKKEWPGRPSRQRLELFLRADPETVIRLVKMARRNA